MGSKKQNDNLVTERRLRPIYDCLDIGNNKKALQEADKLLKKQPDVICAKALRSLALIRLGRTDEATSLLTEIEQADPDEEYTLQALTYCYRDLGKPDRIITLYERVVKKHPQNEDFLSHLMMAYARVGEYKKQNHIAMQLYKLRPARNPYYFWSVMSTVMQAYDDPKLARTMYLPLAERMIEKFLQSDKINAEAEVKLYVLILEMQEKYAEALAVLQGDLASRFVKCMWELHQKIVELLERLQRWQEVYDLCKKNLPENVDDWFLWTHLFISGFELIKADATKKLCIIDELTTMVLSSVQKSEGRIRGPYLARLRLIVCLLERDFIVRSDLGTSPLGEPLDLLQDYFRRFGHKPMLFDDIRPYLCLLGEQQRQEFLGSLESACGNLPISITSEQPESNILLAKEPNHLMIHLSALQLARCLGLHSRLTSSEKQQLIETLMQRYAASLDFGEHLQPTEMQYADGYLLLAFYTLWDLYVEKNDSQIIIEMVLLLENGLKRSPSNYRFKCLLIKLYSLVGASGCLLRIIDTLDAKYVMRDTLWYLVIDHLSPWGFYGEMVDWSRTSLAFYTQSDKEIVDCVIQCYKAGSFPKIVEFFDFRKKLRNSFLIFACQVWRRYFKLINGEHSEENLAHILKGACDDALNESSKWPSYSDNSDFSVIPTWDPDDVTKLMDTRRQEFYQEHIDQLRFYQLLVGLMSLLRDGNFSDSSPTVKIEAAATSETAANESNGETDSSPPRALETLTSLLHELRAHCKFRSNNENTSQNQPLLSLNCSGPVYFGSYLHAKYFDALYMALQVAVDTVKAAVQLGRKSENKMESHAQNGSGYGAETKVHFPTSEEVQTVLQDMFSLHQFATEVASFPFMQLCHISFLVQTISVVLISFSFVYHRLQNIIPSARATGASKDKKSKKKKGGGEQLDVAVTENSAQATLIMDLLRFASIFCQAAETTLRMVEDLDAMLKLSQCSISDTKFVPTDFCATKQATSANIRESYSLSIKHLQRVMSKHLSDARIWCQVKEDDLCR